MHQHPRLRKGGIDEHVVGEVERLEVAAVQRGAEMASQEPVVEQAQFAAEQGLVVARQVVGRGDGLDAQELVDGGVEVRIGVAGVDHVEQGVHPQVLEQQEAALDVAREHPRHPHAAALEEFVHAQPGTHVLQRRR